MGYKKLDKFIKDHNLQGLKGMKLRRKGDFFIPRKLNEDKIDKIVDYIHRLEDRPTRDLI